MTKQAFQMPPATPPRSTTVVMIPLFILSTLLVSMLVGGLLFLASITIGHFIVISAYIASLIAQIAIAQLLRLTKMHYSILALLMGIIAGATIYGTYRFGEYIDVTNDWKDEISEFRPDLTDAEISDLINDDLEAETGYQGFIGFILWEAEQGATTTSSRRGTEQQQDTTFTVIIWLVDIVILIGHITFYTYKDSKQPFCDDLNDWLQLDSIGILRKNEKKMLTDAIQTQDWKRIKEIVYPKHTEYTERRYLEVKVGRCHAAATHAQIVIFTVHPWTSTFLFSENITGNAIDVLTSSDDDETDETDLFED